MDQNEFPPNSNVSKAEGEETKKKIEPIVKSGAVQRKKGLGKRLKEHFTGPDSVSVLDYMINDLAIPAAKEMFADVVTGGLERRLFGTDVPRSRRRFSGAGGANQYGRVDYAGASRNGRRDDRAQISARSRANHDFGEILIPSRAEAEETLSMMYMLLEQYGAVSVSEFLDMCNVTSHFPDQKWGWRDLQGAGVQRLRGGDYVINLPRTEPLD